MRDLTSISVWLTLICLSRRNWPGLVHSLSPLENWTEMLSPGFPCSYITMKQVSRGKLAREEEGNSGVLLCFLRFNKSASVFSSLRAKTHPFQPERGLWESINQESAQHNTIHLQKIWDTATKMLILTQLSLVLEEKWEEIFRPVSVLSFIDHR